jgi:WD40 repeat protein
MFVWQAHEGAVTSLAFASDGRSLVSAGSDECVKAWEPFTGAEELRIGLSLAARGISGSPGTSGTRYRLALAANGHSAVAAESHHRLLFLDLTRGDVNFTRSYAEVRAVEVIPDGRAVVALVCDQPRTDSFVQCLTFEGAAGEKVELGYGVASRALAFSPDGSRFAIGRTIRPWPPVPNGRITSVHTKSYEPEDLAFSADNEHLFALVGGKVVVYSLPHGVFKTKLKGHCGQITAMQLAPDGRRLWTASRDATVKCWDTHALTLDRTFRFDTGGLDCLAVSPDGNVAAVGSAQKGTITVWDLN